MNNQIAISKYQTANAHTSKIRQLILLYEGILKHINNAKTAIKAKDIQARYNHLQKVIDVMNALQVSLDYINGEDSAAALELFYDTMIKKLCLVNINNGTEEQLEQIAKEIKEMKAIWEDVEKKSVATELEKARENINNKNNSPSESTIQGLEINT